MSIEDGKIRMIEGRYMQDDWESSVGKRLTARVYSVGVAMAVRGVEGKEGLLGDAWRRTGRKAPSLNELPQYP